MLNAGDTAKKVGLNSRVLSLLSGIVGSIIAWCSLTLKNRLSQQ